MSPSRRREAVSMLIEEAAAADAGDVPPGGEHADDAHASWIDRMRRRRH